MNVAESQEGDNSTAAVHASVLLRNGGVVAPPTETVYGLGADAICPVREQRK